jgi:aspartyl-tRNA(Asn)/glutamyl-tRNA(Gln) amidotransferase subunit C
MYQPRSGGSTGGMNMITCALHFHPVNETAMSLDREQVRKIAHLARLHITEPEATAYAETLSRILGLIEQMNAVDTTGVVPMAHPNDAGLRLREDAVTETDQRDKFQKIAPAVEAGLYLVPKVIE